MTALAIDPAEVQVGQKRKAMSRARQRVNRRNAKLSTGPRTAEGKAASSVNALKHGVYCRDLVLPGEDPGELSALRSAFAESWHPRNACETLLVDQMVSAAWKLRRLQGAENRIHAEAIAQWSQDVCPEDQASPPEEAMPGDEVALLDDEAASPGPRTPDVGESLYLCLSDDGPGSRARQIEAVSRLEQRLLGTILRCSRELRQLRMLLLRQARQIGQAATAPRASAQVPAEQSLTSDYDEMASFRSAQVQSIDAGDGSDASAGRAHDLPEAQTEPADQDRPPPEENAQAALWSQPSSAGDAPGIPQQVRAGLEVVSDFETVGSFHSAGNRAAPAQYAQVT